MSFNSYQKGKRNHQDNQDGMPEPTIDHIPSPYYFVPLRDQVFHPDWAPLVSHDIPFSDGLSGTLEIEIEATRPLYIRNAGGKPENYKNFRNRSPGETPQDQFDQWVEPYRLGESGPYAIPGTSLKGCLRNVLKIASFGSMREVDDKHVSVRDLRLPAYQQQMAKRDGNAYSPKTQTGWLSEDRNGKWHIVPCKVARVEQEDLEALVDRKVQLGRRQSLSNKRKQWSDTFGSFQIRFSPDNDEGHHHSCGILRYSKASDLNAGSTEGTLVFTGQPSPRRRREDSRGKSIGKHMEFLFHSPNAQDAEKSGKRLSISPKIIGEFILVNQDAEKDVESWEFWKQKLKNGEPVPVFYLTDAGGEITSMGLAQMYRLPAPRKIHDGLPAAHKEKLHDLADTIFGSLDDNPLAGRVSFSACVSENARPHGQILWTVLGSPRPTYYPNYLKQSSNFSSPEKIQNRDGKPTYVTYLSKEIQLRGWKRYAVRPDAASSDASDVYATLPIPKKKENGREVESLDVATAFRPLKPGARFRGKIRFHNLHPSELGALVWTLTWGCNESLRHSLGMAKGLGFGTVHISLPGGLEQSLTDFPGNKTDLAACMKAFETTMSQAIPGWRNSRELKELQILANPENAAKAPSDSLAYPTLNPDKRINQFAEAKPTRNSPDALVLPLYSERLGRDASTGVAPSSSGVAPGSVVECKVTQRKEGKKKASFDIVGASASDTGMLDSTAKDHFDRIPPVGQTIKMKIKSKDGPFWLFTFPD